MKMCKVWSQGARFLALSFTLLIAQKTNGQAPPIFWQTNIWSQQYAYGTRVIAVDEFTNVYASSNGTVVKLSSAGVPLQTNVFTDLPGTMQRDAAGNFYFSGFRLAHYAGVYYYGSTNACFLAKFTSSGSLVWSNGFGPTGSVYYPNMRDIQVNTAGEVYVGFTYCPQAAGASTYNSVVAKFDSTGSNVWTSVMPRYGYNDVFGTIRLSNVSPTNGYALTYDDPGSSTLPSENTLSRFDSNGTPTIVTNWATASGLNPPLILDAAGNFFNSEGVASSGSVSLKRRSPQGDVIWSRDVGNSDQIPAGSDVYDGVLAAESNSPRLRRYDVNGYLAWTLNLPSPCQEVFLDSSGNRFVSTVDGTIVRIGGETFSAPTITIPPQPQTVFVGSNVTFSVGATGTTPYCYYWFFNDSLVSFQTNSSLALSNATIGQIGSYYVIVSNIVSTVTSTPVQLRVKQTELYVGNQLLTNGTYNFTTNPTITVRSAFTNGSIYYTLDGAAPNFTSTLYSGPFGLFSNATVRAIGYSADFSKSEEADAVNAVVLAHHSLTALTAGGGTINLSPPGGDYLSSDTVTATAVPDAGWSFLYWAGNASGSNSSIDILMHSDKTIHAVFGTTLSTTVQGNGQVLLDPMLGVYLYGQTVRLTGVPASGSYFGAWGNAVASSTNPLYFTVTNPNPTVSSIFSTNGPNQVSLTVEIHGLGKVAASPQANVYTTGQSVMLTATADPGQTFLSWSGNVSATQNPLNLVLNQSQLITANFTGIPRLRISQQFQEGLQPDGFHFSLISDPGSIYEIRYSSNLFNWDSLGFVTNTPGETPLLDTNALNLPKRYYQLKP